MEKRIEMKKGLIISLDEVYFVCVYKGEGER